MREAKVYEINQPPYSHLVIFRRKGFKTYKRRFRDAETAKADCDDYNERMLKEGAEGVHIAPADREKIVTALRILDGTGISIVQAAEMARIAWEGEGAGAELKALAFSHLEDLERKGRDFKTIRDRKWRLNAFFETGAKTVADLTAERIERFVFDQGSPASGRNMVKNLSAFCNWLKRAGYLKENPCLGIDRPQKAVKEAVAILTPWQAWAFLGRLQRDLPEAVGFYAVLLFAFLRPSEAEQLTGKDFQKNTIRVTKGKMRGRSRRLAPLTPTLRAWLDAYPFTVPSDRQQRNARELCPVHWQPDICRHTGITYRLAETGDVKQVALDSGNSETVIFADYYELTEPGRAALFSRIRPLESITSKTV